MPSAQPQGIVEPTTSSQSSYLSGLSSNQNLTAVAWVDYGGGGGSTCEGVFGSGGYTTNGFQIVGYPGSDCGLFYLDSYSAPWPSGTASLPVGKWMMLTGEYQSQSGQMYAYINGSMVSSYDVFGSGPTTVNTIPSNGLYYIGDAAWSSNGIDTFNGMISNIQLYNRALTPGQIQNLYSAGPSGIPIQNNNLIGWWPLDGTVDDLSGYGNNGTSSALFANSQYGSPSGYYLASFNQSSNAVIPHANAPLINAPFSISFMFSTTQPYTANFVSELVDGEQPLGSALNISLCGGASRTVCPNGYGLTTSIGTGSGALGTKTYKFGFSANTLYDVTETFGTGGSTLFINGINVSYFSYSGTPTVVGGTNYLQIGGSAMGNPLNGQITDLAVYNSVLTAQQAMQLYEQGLPSIASVNLTG